jgi:Concanavalin A-like lectin/glucanases superfamily
MFTDFKDSSTNDFAITANGDAQLVKGVKKYGNAAGYFDGDGDYLETPNLFDFASQDWTIEFWLKCNTQSDVHIIANIASGESGINIYIDGSNSITYNNGLTATSVGTSYAPHWNQWTHIALVRSGSTISMYVDGTLAGTPTSQTPGSNQFLYIGKSGYGHEFNGYIDDLRITKGIARYTANFIPPTQQLPDPSDPHGANVSLLLHMDGTNGSQSFVDSSNNNFTITANGDAQISDAEKKLGNGAAYFDGDGDFLEIADNDAFELQGNNFTIEYWIRPTILDSNYQAIASKASASQDAAGWILYIDVNNTINFLAGTGSWSVFLLSEFNLTINTWYHVAATRSGNNWYLFINGDLKASTTDSLTLNTGNLPLYIGWYPYFDGLSTSDQSFGGYIDDLRITKGVARYTANFVPQTAAFANPTV